MKANSDNQVHLQAIKDLENTQRELKIESETRYSKLDYLNTMYDTENKEVQALSSKTKDLHAIKFDLERKLKE